MTSEDFPGATLKIGKGQEDHYTTVHALPLDGPQGEVIAIYQLTDEEVENIVKNRRIYYSRWTFGQPFQPMRIQTTPITINLGLNDGQGNESKVIAHVTHEGLQVDGYKNLGDGQFLKLPEDAGMDTGTGKDA